MPNGYNDFLGWSVGIKSWLDSEESKVNRYWRAIENGSTFWAGQHIVGLWSNNPGVNPRPPGKNQLHEGELDAMGFGAGQKFAPFFKSLGGDMDRAGRAALLYFFGVDGPVSTANPEKLALLRGATLTEDRRILYWLLTKAHFTQMPFVHAFELKPMLAKHYYAKALANLDPMRMEVLALEKQLGMMGLPGVDVYTPSGMKQARELVADDYNLGKKPKVGPVGYSGRSKKAGGVPVDIKQLTGDGTMMTVNISVTVRDFIRGSGNRFSPWAWRDMVRQVNLDIASAYQAEVVRLMRMDNQKRRPTGDLIRATESPQNRRPSITGY